MPIHIDNTANVALSGIKGLVYGPPGVGKTTLCATADYVLIISAEKGLLSIKDKAVDFVEVKSIADIGEVYSYLTTSEDYSTVCLDSISDIAEVVLSELKPLFKDTRQAYGEMADQMLQLVRAFRDLENYNVIFTAKSRRIVDPVGVSSFVPSTPGQVLPEAIPYMFDLVMPMHIGKDAEGKQFRYLQTQPDLHWIAKDRSGVLDKMEYPDLNHLFNKIIEANPMEEVAGDYETTDDVDPYEGQEQEP